LVLSVLVVGVFARYARTSVAPAISARAPAGAATGSGGAGRVVGLLIRIFWTNY